jgi:hypothetical protein
VFSFYYILFMSTKNTDTMNNASKPAAVMWVYNISRVKVFDRNVFPAVQASYIASQQARLPSSQRKWSQKKFLPAADGALSTAHDVIDS